MFLFIYLNGEYDLVSMSIHSVCSNAPTLRLVSQAQRLKWALTSNKNMFYCRKVLQSFCDLTPKITYAHSSVQSYKYEIQDVSEKEQSFYLRENFLKENFNIVNSHNFKLITHPGECNHLEELLWTDEFKKILSRSSFTYDVNVADSSRNLVKEASDFYPHSPTIVCSYQKVSVSKPSVSGFDIVLISNTEIKENMNGKASEEQLLYVINRLTYSLINFFEKPHDFSIYHKNIVFQNNIKGVTTRGLSAYAQTMYIMKLYGLLHFSKVKVEILKVTHHVEDGSIRVRWRVNGLPRHKIFIMLWKYKRIHSLPKEGTEWLDGFSIFSVGDDGLIYKHICDKMIPDDEQVLSKNVDIKSRVLGLLGLAPRRPAALNTLIPCCRNQDLVSCKKLT